jgi:hypothetical protein
MSNTPIKAKKRALFVFECIDTVANNEIYVMAPTKDDAEKALVAKGIIPYRDMNKVMWATMVAPHEIKATDRVILSLCIDAKVETTMYQALSVATGLKYAVTGGDYAA